MRTRIRLIALFCALSLLTFAGNSPLRAQTPEPADVSINYIEAASNNDGTATISAYVSVVDSAGQPLTGLTAGNFSLLENSAPVEISSAEITQDPIALVLAIDTSGSMAQAASNGQLAIELAKQAAVSFVAKLAPEDRVAVISFNDEIITEQNLDVDHNAAINAINQLGYKDFGATCLYDAAIEAVQNSTEIQQGRRAVILLTDGVDEKEGGPCSLHTFTDVVSEATRPTSKVPIFTVGFGQADEQELVRMARLTGGRGNVVEQPTQLEGLFDEISQQLKNQYRVQYQTNTPGERSVVVKAESGGVSKSDERLVFVPPLEQPATPTPTPLPAELAVVIMEATKDKPEKGDLEIVVSISEPERATQAELFVDDVSQQVLAQPPLDRFVVALDALSPGNHVLRIEVTDDLGRIATDRREIAISEPPTPAPTAAPPPPAPEPPPFYSNTLAMVLIGAACLLLLLVAGIGLFYLLRRGKKPAPAQPSHATVAPPPMPSVGRLPETSPATAGRSAFDTIDELAAARPMQQDPFATIDEVLVINAGLIVIESETIKGQAFKMTQPEVTLGRDAGGTKHNFNVPDKSVSRNHAKISFDGRNYRIFDTGSSNGTKVDDVLVGPEGTILNNRAVIQLGKHTKLRFNIGKSGVGATADDPYETMDDAIDNDPFKTADDIS